MWLFAGGAPKSSLRPSHAYPCASRPSFARVGHCWTDFDSIDGSASAPAGDEDCGVEHDMDPCDSAAGPARGSKGSLAEQACTSLLSAALHGADGTSRARPRSVSDGLGRHLRNTARCIDGGAALQLPPGNADAFQGGTERCLPQGTLSEWAVSGTLVLRSNGDEHTLGTWAYYRDVRLTELPTRAISYQLQTSTLWRQHFHNGGADAVARADGDIDDDSIRS